MGDLFRLQDDIARRVSEVLAVPLSGSTASPTPDAPHDPRAYELYLRANELARTYDGLPRARDLYQHCLELDPRFAPAWAHLGRCHRVIGKYIEDAPDSEMRAEEALRRALALNPRLSVAHKFYANLEADIGQAQAAVVRLLGEADASRQRSGAVRRARPRLPLLRPERAIDRGARGGAPARSERSDERRADAA